VDLVPRTVSSRLKKLLLAAVALAGLYLLAANLFLNTPLGPWAVNRNPQKLRVAWSRAWSLYPGDVRVGGLSIEGHSSRVDWSVVMDRGRGWIDLPALARKRFRVHGLTAEGVRSSTARHAATGDGARRVPRNPWRFEMRDISLRGVREIAYDSFRLEGAGTASGGFSLTAGGDFALAPSVLHMPGARLLLGKETVAQDLAVDAEVAIAPYAPRHARGVAGFDFVTGALKVQGKTAPRLAAQTGDLAAGDLALDLRLDRGRLTPGSRATWRAGSPWTALLAVETNPGGPRLVLRADGRELALGRRTEGPPLAGAETLHLEAAAGETRLSRLLAEAGQLRRTGELPAGTLRAAFHAAGLRLSAAGAVPAWQIAAETAEGSIDLPSLLRRQLLVQDLRADGITVRAQRTE
jgi:hypothetical protein